MRDTGDYAVPHPHPHTHHYMTTTDTPRSISRVGSCPGSTRGSIHGSNSGSSPGADIHSVHHGSHPSVMDMSSTYNDSGHSSHGRAMSYSQFECAHYDRMPIPIPVQIPIVPPPPPMNLHSEEEIEPAYATGRSNTDGNCWIKYLILFCFIWIQYLNFKIGLHIRILNSNVINHRQEILRSRELW